MKLLNISPETMDNFVSQNSKSHFMQTSSWGDVAKTRNQIPHLLGIYKEDELIATALLLEKKIGPFSSFYCPRGFIGNYSSKEDIKEIINLLKKYIKRHHGLYLRMDPDLIIHKLNEKAEVKETFEDNEALIDFFISLGATYKGKTILFKEMSNPRFTFRVPWKGDTDTLLNQCQPTTRNILNRETPVHIYKNPINGIKDFYETMSSTARKKAIYLEPYTFFDNFYHILHQANMSDVWVAEVNKQELISYYDEKELSLNEQLNLATSDNATKKQKALKNDLLDQLKKIAKERKELDDIKEERIVLSSVITAKYQDKVWIVHGGNNDILRSLFANYILYFNILKDGQEEGRLYGDLFGTEGKVDKKSDVYGIYLFKLRFGGDFDEFIGEFDFVTKPISNAIISKLLKIRRRLLIKKSVKESRNEH